MHKKKLTIEQKIEIVKMYIENGESKTEIGMGTDKGLRGPYDPAPGY